MTRSKAPRSTRPTEIESLRARLQEAEEALDAIRHGHIEALVVTTPEGPKVFTLEGADHRYRRLVETMNEGALLVSEGGVLLYSNAAFAHMVDAPLADVIGGDLLDFVEISSQPKVPALLGATSRAPVEDEVVLVSRTGARVAAFISATSNDFAQEPGACLIVTNLTVQKRNEEIVASERLASSILEQAADAIIVCDREGRVLRASHAAIALSSPPGALHRPFAAAFPLVNPNDGAAPVDAALAGHVVTELELTLAVSGRPTTDVICASAPLFGEREAGREIIGCVVCLTNITVRKRAERERVELLEAERKARTAVEHALAHAETSSRAKDEFLASVSHELRTPLNAILGWSRLLSQGAVPDERISHAVAVIERNALAQAQLIEDLLDVSRIVSGQMRLDVQPVEPISIIQAALDSARPAMDAKKIQLDATLDTKAGLIVGDGARIQQIVWNLVSNAAKFTPRGGKVRVALAQVDSVVELVVADNGQGIPAAFLPYVFDRFRQADASMTRRFGGLGLGLAITRHLVELHGGSIGVASDGEGRGATFTVRLPRAAVLPKSVDAPRTEKPKASAGTLEIPPEMKGLRVLVVDDDTDSRDMLVAILDGCGAITQSASSASVALTILESDIPDILVSDIGMADMDGYELIRRVRALPDARAKGLPAIALTAYARPDDRKRALGEGYQIHQPKPVEPSELITVVGSLVRSRKLTDGIAR